MADPKAKIVITAENRTARAFRSVNESLTGMQRAVFSLKGALTGITAGGLIRTLDTFSKGALEANAAFVDFSRRLGASAGGLSELAVAADIAGVSMSEVNLAVQRSTRRIGEAAQGYGEAKSALEQLGVSAKDLTKIPADQQFNKLADALLKVENPSQRLTLAFKLFDSEGTAVIQMLDELEKAKGIARDTGAVITQDEVIAIQAYREEIAKTNAAWRSLEQAFLSSGVGRAVEIIKQKFIGFGEIAVDVIATIGKSIGALAASIGALAGGEFSRVTSIWREFAADVKSLFGDQEGAKGGISGLITGGPEQPAKEQKTLKTFQDITRELAEQYQHIKAQIDGRETQYAIVEAIRRAERELDRELIKGEPELIAQLVKDIEAGKKELESMNKETKKTNEFAREMGLTFSSAFENAIVEGQNLREVLKGIYQDILRITVRKSITEPIGSAISAAIGNFLPAFASGTSFAPGGLSLVGERGPELVNLPRGSQVSPAGSFGGVTINVDARGSTDPLSTERAVKRAIDGAVSTIRDMRVRGKLPEFA